MDDLELQEDLDLMRQQIDACNERLQQFTRSVREEQASQRLEPFEDILEDVIEQWMIQRPDVNPPRGHGIQR